MEEVVKSNGWTLHLKKNMLENLTPGSIIYDGKYVVTHVSHFKDFYDAWFVLGNDIHGLPYETFVTKTDVEKYYNKHYKHSDIKTHGVVAIKFKPV